MAIYVNNNKEIENIYVSVNGIKKNITSAYINANGIPQKIFGISSISENDPYETAPEEAYSNWNYTLDDENNIITLNYYTGSETDVIVYTNYEVDGKIYKTQIASNNTIFDYRVPYMFNGYPQTNCRNIRTIIFSRNIDTSNVTTMCHMFNNCQSLTTIEGLDSFDTSNVTDMNNMFSSCCGLSSLDISHFDTGKVVNMQAMFSVCNNLTSLDLSNFDTGNVTNMSHMFSASSALTTLDLCSFDTRNVTTMADMFSYCRAMTSIYVTEGKWSTSQANTGNMFNRCGTSSVTYK